MGYVRFFRRKQIVPGIRMNLSKSGPSVSFGGRGFHYTVGHGRRRTTVGVPGTGLFYTSTGSHPRTATRRATSPRAMAAPPKKSLTQTIRESPGVGIVVGVIVMLIGIPFLALLPVGLVIMALGLYCILLGASVLRGPAHRVMKLLAKADRIPQTAEPLLQAGLATFPGDPGILSALAGIWLTAGHDDQAVAAYRQILTTDPANTHVQGELADALLHLGNWKDAIPLLNAVRQHPQLDEESQFSVIAHLALAYMAIGDHQQAVALADTAPLQRRTMSLGLQQCLFMRAAARYFTGQHAQAVKDLDRLYAMAPAFAGLAEAKAGMADGTFHVEYAGHLVAGMPTAG